MGQGIHSITSEPRFYKRSQIFVLEEVQDLTYFELTILRNELYAMQGYVFSNPWLASYFESQEWYTPSPGFNTTAEFPVEFTNQQQDNIELFLFAAEGLEPTVHGCWYTGTSDLTVEYYRDISYLSDIPSPPDYYNAFTSVPQEIGAHPQLDESDLLPYYEFNELCTGYGHNQTEQQMSENRALLERYGVDESRIYRVELMPDRTISKVERITIEYLGPASPGDPYTLWQTYYATNSMYIIFIPDCRQDWASRDIALLYRCENQETSLKAAFLGRNPLLTMEIYQGPYEQLPVSIQLTDEEIGGYDKYESIFFSDRF